MATGTAILVVTIISAAVSAYGAYQQGETAKKSAKYQSQIAQRNADIARRNAALQGIQQDRLNRLRLGTIRAAAGASGGVSDQGSVLELVADSAIQGELKRQDIIRAGEIKAAGLEAGSALTLFEGEAASTAGKVGAASALLGGASSAAGKSETLNRTG